MNPKLDGFKGRMECDGYFGSIIDDAREYCEHVCFEKKKEISASAVTTGIDPIVQSIKR